MQGLRRQRQRRPRSSYSEANSRRLIACSSVAQMLLLRWFPWSAPHAVHMWLGCGSVLVSAASLQQQQVCF
jgi:hypothetical protein